MSMRPWKVRRFLLAALIIAAGWSVLLHGKPASAANPTTMNFQGKVVNANGTNVTDGTYSFVFKLYTVSSGGTALWTETQSSVSVSAGIFQVNLGSICPFFTANACNNSTPIDFNGNPNLYLGITFNSDPAGEMSPRVQLQSVPFAYNADKVGGFSASQLVQLSPGSQQSGFINVSGASTFGNNLTIAGILNANATGKTALTLADSGAQNSGLTIGGDTNLYRSGGDTLKTDDNFIVGIIGAGGTNLLCYDGSNKLATCSAAPGAGSYIYNGTSLQTAGNFYIQAANSGVNGTVGGIIRGAAGGQTVDLFQLQNTGGTALAGFNAAGDLYLGDNGSSNIVLTSEANASVNVLQLGKDGSGALKEQHITSADQTGTGAAAAMAINPGAAAGLNQNGAFLTLAGGLGTGTGEGGSIFFNISPPGSSGSSSNSFVNAWGIDGGDGAFYPLFNITYDIGYSGFRVRSVYTGTVDIATTSSTTGALKQNGTNLVHTYGTNNFFAGSGSGNLTTTGTGANTAVGVNTLTVNTTGNNNTAIGVNALVSNQGGNLNAALGSGALGFNVGGTANTGIGGLSLYSNSSGNFNTAVGYQAGYTSVAANANTIGSNNTFIGYNAGPGVASASSLQNATAIGYAAVVNQNDSLVLGCINGTNGCTATTKIGIGTATPSALLHVSSSSTDPLFRVTDATATARDVVNIADGGAATFRNQTDSTVAFQIQNSAGSALLTADTSNVNLTMLAANGGETAAWQDVTGSTPLPVARDGAVVLTGNGYVYVLGGNSSGPTSTIFYAKLNANGTLGSWTNQGSVLPGNRIYASGAVANGYIYLVSGSTTTAAAQAQATVFYARLNPDGSTDTWTSQSPSGLSARLSGATVAYNGYIYLIGGQTTASAFSNATQYAKLNADGSTGTWATTTTMPGARDGGAVTAANGYVYYIGGNDGSTAYQNTVFYAKLNSAGTTGTWSTNGTTLNTGRNSLSGQATVVNGYVYVAGGEGSGPTSLTSVEYAPLNSSSGAVGSWTTSTKTLPAGRVDASLFSANGYLYVMGGTDGTIRTSVYYASTSRLQLNGSLDLVGISGRNLNEGGSGGTLTAGDTRVVGKLDVRDNASFGGGLSVQGDLVINSGGDTAVTVTDGTNTLAKIIDANASGVNFGVLQLGAKASTGNDATQCAAAADVGKVYVNSTDKAVFACTAANVWEQLDNSRFNQIKNSGSYTVTTTNAIVGGADTLTITPSATVNDVRIDYSANFNFSCTGLGCSPGTVTINLYRGTACASGTLIQSYTLTEPTSGSVSATGYSAIDTAPAAGSNTYIACAQRSGGGGTITDTMSNRSLILSEVDTSGADYAEIYYSRNGALMPGTVVNSDPVIKSGVQPSSGRYQKGLVGVVSTQPGQVLSDGSDTGTPVVVALAGRVPVKVSAENGPVRVGDPLTSSSMPGVAMKATKAGAIIGTALSAYSGTDVGEVMVFVGTGFSAGSLPLTIDGGPTEGKLLLNDLMIHRAQTAAPADLSTIFTDRLAAAVEIVTPKLMSDEVHTNTIVVSENGINFKNEDGATIAHLDTSGVLRAADLSASTLTETAKSDISAATVQSSGSSESAVTQSSIDFALASLRFDSEGTLNLKSASLSGGLTVGGDTSFAGLSTFQKMATFLAKTVFRQDVDFEGHITVAKDTAGYASLRSGEKTVHVIFAQPYLNPPIVTANSVDGQFTLHSISNVTNEGFDINVQTAATGDVRFSWMAFGATDPQTATNLLPSVE